MFVVLSFSCRKRGRLLTLGMVSAPIFPVLGKNSLVVLLVFSNENHNHIVSNKSQVEDEGATRHKQSDARS